MQVQPFQDDSRSSVERKLNPEFFALQPPKVDYVKCAHDTGDGWYFFWAPLDEGGYPEDTGEEFSIFEFPVNGDRVSSHELGLMGITIA